MRRGELCVYNIDAHQHSVDGQCFPDVELFNIKTQMTLSSRHKQFTVYKPLLYHFVVQPCVV